MDLKAAMIQGHDSLSDARLQMLSRKGQNLPDNSKINATSGSTAKSGSAASELAKVKKVAEDFESVFLEQMLKSMRSSVQKSGLIDGGNAEQIYVGMLDSEYAKSMAHQRTSGIADMIERQLLESMGVKTADLNNPTKHRGLSAYRSDHSPPLQDASKRVTMDSVSRPTPIK